MYVGAGVVELVDTPDLGSGDASYGGSSPSVRTKSFRVKSLKDFKVIDRR